MSYAVVMVYVDATGLPEGRVRVAASLADKYNATLIGLSALAIPPPFLFDGAVIHQAPESDIGQMMARLNAKEEWFRRVATANHRGLEWRPILDYPTDALAREARSADLVVIGQTKVSGDPLNSLDPGEALLKLGRPTLIVPDGVSSLSADHIVVGWKDTREARRIVQDGLPFFHEASHVTVVEICELEEESAAKQHTDDVVRYLVLHRVKAIPRVIVRQDGSAADQIVKLAREEVADLIVTGAYGHTRLGEWMFGGVTRDLLANSSICCLMSH
jgi:nucleotide-binding universal stress UspA family protein